MDAATLAQWAKRLAEAGPRTTAAELSADLEQRHEYGSLFYALLMGKRIELGLSPIPTGPSTGIPDSAVAEYEEAIRQAGRKVGQLYLAAGAIDRAWPYFRMIGEPQPVADAIARYQPSENDDPQAVIEIALQQGVAPAAGFELFVARYGICSAITFLSGHDFGTDAAARRACVGKLVRSLHAQLVERLHNDIATRGEHIAATVTDVAELLANRAWLTADDAYHVDVSHLSAIVQMTPVLTDAAELQLARELCLYGQHLGATYRYAGEPPFEELYHDHAKYLAAVQGVEVEATIAHFMAKLPPPGDDDGGPMAAEAVVNLLVRVGQPARAVEVARDHLANAPAGSLRCPSLLELCQQTGNYAALAHAAAAHGDPVHYLAALIADGSKTGN
jgi:hypothetical protein